MKSNIPTIRFVGLNLPGQFYHQIGGNVTGYRSFISYPIIAGCSDSSNSLPVVKLQVEMTQLLNMNACTWAASPMRGILVFSRWGA